MTILHFLRNIFYKKGRKDMSLGSVGKASKQCLMNGSVSIKEKLFCWSMCDVWAFEVGIASTWNYERFTLDRTFLHGPRRRKNREKERRVSYVSVLLHTAAKPHCIEIFLCHTILNSAWEKHCERKDDFSFKISAQPKGLRSFIVPKKDDLKIWEIWW